MFDDLLAANRKYSAEFHLGGIASKAAKGFALVTCIDSRLEPLTALGLHPGDSKILRNAGGRVTPDVLRSLVLATTLLGVDRIAVMHHTDCALARTNDDEIRATLTESQRAGTAGWQFLTMDDPDAALAADVAAIRTCPALPAGLLVEGWRYDVATGLVDRVITIDDPVSS